MKKFSSSIALKAQKRNCFHSALTLIVLLAGLPLFLKGQGLPESPVKSPFTYIYKITDQEARTIYRKGVGRKPHNFLHSLVDSFPTDSAYSRKLPPGHYIKTFADRNQQRYFITTVRNFDVMILPNNKDLMVRVYDSIGGLVENARVRAGSKSLRYDTSRKAYVDKRSNRKGILSVEHLDQQAFFDLNRQRNNPGILRATNYVLLETPLKYAWMPVHFVLSLPVDGYRSVDRGWPQGTIQRTARFFSRVGGRIGCFFDDYYCDDHYERFENSHKGYMAFNKPMYQPGDTVKLKAFVLNKRGKPVSRQAEVVLYHRNKRMVLGTVEPYTKGGFSFEFPLHDSLQLQLNRRYSVELEQKLGKSYISESFSYEDYELSGITLSVRTSGEKHYRGIPFYLYVKGADENDLQIMDGRLEVYLLARSVEEYFSAATFIPDTLDIITLPLDYNRETTIQLPDSVMPHASFRYDVVTRLLTASNEVLTQNKALAYYHEKKEFDITQAGDSLVFRYLETGVEKQVPVVITARDNFSSSIVVSEGKTPVRTAISPWFTSYHIQGNGVKGEKKVADLQPQLNFFTHRTRDSLKVNVRNPLEIPVSYQLYRQNRLLADGYSHQPDLNMKARSRRNYFLGVQYLWGGRMINSSYRIALNDHQLTVVATQPPVIFPGQTTTIDLKVTDIDGKPVEGVDITAQGLTSKFNSSSPQLPFLGNWGKHMRHINSFHFEQFSATSSQRSKLDFNRWKAGHQLDSLAYYRFLYPGVLQRFDFYTSDSTTQFAPFIMSDGRPEPVYVVYVDHKPVWFSFVNVGQPWSFRVQSGFRHVRIRTRDKEYVIPFLHFKDGQKLVLSIDKDISSDQVLVYSRPARLDNQERSLLSDYLFTFRSPGGEMDHWLLNHGNVLRMNHNRGRYFQNRVVIGPVAGEVKFVSYNRYELSFRHEPGFEYEFAPSILKMRSVDALSLVPKKLNLAPSQGNYLDDAFTEEMLVRIRENMIAERRNNILYNRNPLRGAPGTGTVEITLPENSNTLQPENILVYNLKDPLNFRLYRGNSRRFVSFSPGIYRFVMLYPENRYFFVDLNVRASGINHVRIDLPDELFKNQPYREFSSLITGIQMMFDSDISAVFDESMPVTRRSSEVRPIAGNKVTGRVLDSTDGTPLPGVTIVVKGTTIGTVTDFEGNYALSIPSDDAELDYSFIGFIVQRVLARDVNGKDVLLVPDIAMLSEIVVVGYGSQRRRWMDASYGDMPVIVDDEAIFTFDQDEELIFALQGRAAGVMAISGSPGVTIRGVSSIDAQSSPMIIIDGVPYLGDLSALDPALFADMQMLKGAEATAIYGSRGANGVLVISTGGRFAQLQNLEPQPEAFEMPEFAGSSSNLRTNFSDYAFWQPRLVTDRQGRASFQVTFPDDITRWDTHYTAMNAKSQAGNTTGSIRSYLPLSAQLALPRFLVLADTAFALGKVLNYVGDSVIVGTRFLVDDVPVWEKSISFTHAFIDTLMLSSQSTDSLKITYTITRDDGYFDGEERHVRVFPQGMEETTGAFHILSRDSLLSLSFDENRGNVKLYARSNVLDVLEEEIENVLDFRFYCNEQIASRIKALAARKMIREARGERFTQNILMNRLIRRLEQGQVQPGMWGWWKESEPSAWITLHAIEALQMAASVGFESTPLPQNLAAIWVGRLERSDQTMERIHILKILHALNTHIDYPGYLQRIEKAEDLPLIQFLHLIRLKQLSGMPHSLDTIWSLKQGSLTGNVWFTDNSNHFTLLRNDIQTTLLIHEILENDTASHAQVLEGIRNYFLTKRRSGFWRNTYESSKIIETIVPVIIRDAHLSEPTELSISGDLELTIKEFPFELDAGMMNQISVTRKGSLPIYFTAWQSWHNPAPPFRDNDLRITTHFLNTAPGNVLEAGREVTLQARVTVKKEAEYTMITIPIPAGCSYSDGQDKGRREVHREYFRNEVVIFCEKLPIGDYTFDVNLIPRYTGRYHLNPAQVKLMYFPVFNANEAIKRVVIE